MLRKIKSISSTTAQLIGEHKMYQPLPDTGVDQISPFLLLHHHGPHLFQPYNQGLPFGPHPHRGFETLTFIFEGEIEHADSQGFKSVIKDGGVQWMTAGRGIVHSENLSAYQREHGGPMEIIQLWMNLPAAKKMITPTYQGFQKSEIPVVKSTDNKVEVSVISGEFQGQKGVANSVTGLEFLNINMQKGGSLNLKVSPDKNILLYVLDGEVKINSRLVIGTQLVQFGMEGESIELFADENTRLIFGTGSPINEPMVAQGPFVMNTTTEIMQAMRDYQMGKMGIM